MQKQHSPFLTLLEAILDSTVVECFSLWFTLKNFIGDPRIVLRKIQPAIWRAFCRSDQAKTLGYALPPWDESILKAPPATPQPQRPDLAQVDTPDPVPAPAPIPAPQPVTQPAPEPVTQPAPVSPLVAAIIQELEAAGYKATAGPEIDTDTVLDLVQSTVQTMLDKHASTLQDLLDQAKKPKQTLVIRHVNSNATESVTGHVPAWFPRLRLLAEARVPALLVGPAGSGKTTAAQKLAECMGVPFYRLSLSAGTDEGEFAGRLLPIGDNMRFEYVLSLMTHAYTEGGVLLADDIDLSDANILGLMNAALDGGQWFISARYQEPLLQKHPDFYLVAAANTHGHGGDRQYVGAQQLDERTLSRFRLGQINCDYDADLESAVFPEAVTETGHRIRNRCRALPGWTRDVSTRDLASVTKLSQYMDAGQAWYGFFADWSSEDCEKIHVHVDHQAMTTTLL